MRTITKEKLLNILNSYWEVNEKVEELLNTWYTIFNKIPSSYREHSAIYFYFDKENNKLLEFHTEWIWDIKTARRFFEKWKTNSKKYNKIYKL